MDYNTSDNFTVINSKKSIVTCASDISYNYNVLLKIKSKKTGNIAEFKLTKRHVDREGELTHETFEPTEKTLEKIKILKGYVVVVFND